MCGKSNNKIEKNQKANGKCLPINVAHGIEEDTRAFPGVDHNTIHRDMPTLLIGMVVVDVPPPC